MDQRIGELRKANSNLDKEYKRMDLLRTSIREVKKNAIANQVARVSPKKLYSGVKSKVAANMKTLKSSKKPSRPLRI